MATIKETKVRRTPINGTRNRLSVRGKEPGFVYRIVNDTDDRIQTMQEIGYEIVTNQGITVGDNRIANPTQEGSPAQISVGQGTKAYVMRQKQEWFDEDQKAKQVRIDELEGSIKKDAESAGLSGKIKISNG